MYVNAFEKKEERACVLRCVIKKGRGKEVGKRVH